MIRDGERRVALGRFTQRPRVPYGWLVRRVRVVDFTGDGRPEILWRQGTSGGTGSSPAAVGVVAWDGRRARRLLRHSHDSATPEGYGVDWFQELVSERGAVPEIEIREGLEAFSRKMRPQYLLRTTRLRWDGKRLAPVPESRSVRPTR